MFLWSILLVLLGAGCSVELVLFGRQSLFNERMYKPTVWHTGTCLVCRVSGNSHFRQQDRLLGRLYFLRGTSESECLYCFGAAVIVPNEICTVLYETEATMIFLFPGRLGLVLSRLVSSCLVSLSLSLCFSFSGIPTHIKYPCPSHTHTRTHTPSKSLAQNDTHTHTHTHTN